MMQIVLFQNQHKTIRESYFNGHVTPKGNKVIAETFYKFLRDIK